MKTIILGPPGTGKTTTLLDLVDEFAVIDQLNGRWVQLKFVGRMPERGQNRQWFVRELHGVCMSLLSMRWLEMNRKKYQQGAID